MAYESHVDGNFETGAYWLKFHLVYHVFDDLGRFGRLEVVDESQFGRFIVYIKRAYRTISQRQSPSMPETVGDMDITIQEGLRRSVIMRNVELSLEAGKRIHIELVGRYLVSFRERTTFMFFETL